MSDSCDSICNFLPMSAPEDVINIINFIWERNPESDSDSKISAYYLLSLVTDGEGLLLIRNRTYRIKKGDIFFVCPAIPYQIINQENLSYMYIGYLGLRATKIMETLHIQEHKPVFPDYKDLIPFWTNAIQSLSQVNLGILCESVLLYSLSKISERIPTRTEPSENSHLVHRIKKYIDENMTDPDLSLDKICLHFSYSQKYVSSIFGKSMGISFSRYLTTIRIQYACALMEAGEHSVSRISEACGFSDRLYFSKVFKSIMGVPPKEHIKNLSLQ